ncbi:MAG TPA: helix-turn-helix domain-containing protein [Candidatus Omnitrophota bacterium]|jgi:two-component system nitrogen regulation response regulator GlnG|nr:helix-turn-helix domain-containing protein [Candidatus Omnitrophota bacterium]
MDIKTKVLELEKELFSEKEGILYRSILQIVEKPLIENILERTDGNQLKAARILGLNRNTLRTKIKRLGINIEKWKNT